MKNILARSAQFLICFAICSVLSWVSIYAFWFAVWTFHSVGAARAADFVGTNLLFPARWIFEWIGADQTVSFDVPVAYAGTNGLVLGILLYSLYRGLLFGRRTRHQAGSTPSEATPRQPVGQKVG